MQIQMCIICPRLRRSVRNAQQGITALDQWEATMSVCLELTLPCCAPGDTTAPQVPGKTAAVVTLHIAASLQ